MRDQKWVKENGHTPTLMDYSRFNYVAQPEDGIDPADLIPEDRALRQVGDDVGLQADSDRQDAGGGEADARQVGARAGQQAVPPLLDGGRRAAIRATMTEAVGDADAVAATTLGVKNLRACRRC